MLSTKEVSQIVQERFSAWQKGDLATTIDLYHDDVRYWDTQTGNGINGKAALTEHAGRFLRDFDVHYAILEEHRLEGQDAAIALWESAVRPRKQDGAAGAELMMQRGMSILYIQDGLIIRDECYNDLAALSGLIGKKK